MNRKKISEKKKQVHNHPLTRLMKPQSNYCTVLLGQSLDSTLCCKIQTMLPTKMVNQKKITFTGICAGTLRGVCNGFSPKEKIHFLNDRCDEIPETDPNYPV